MTKSFLDSVARTALLTFSISLVSPLAWANISAQTSTANESEMTVAVNAYNKALPVYEKKGLQAFLDSIPQTLLSQSNKRFIVSEARGSIQLPQIALASPTQALISLHHGNEDQRVTLETKDLDKRIFAVNGHEFVASRDMDENFKSIMQILSEANKISQNPVEWLIPSAQAHGAAAWGLVLGIAGTAAAGIVGICLAAHALHQNKADKSDKSSEAPAH